MSGLLLMSPSKRQRLAADAQQADQRQSMTTSHFRDAAVGYLNSRLVYSHGPQAATLQLRPSLQKVHDDLVAVLDSAVQLKQNASLLVIGEPGIGKTMVLERVLRSSMAQHNIEQDNPTLGAVRLSGVLHCDERTAFQEIARQLCSTFNIPFSRSASFDDNLAFFKEVLAELQRAFKTVVFVIDQLEAFMRAAKQTLLYNVLDALQHSRVQAVVFGVSCYFDVQDMMEKRVRSRFSNRKVFLTGLCAAQQDADESHAAVLASLLHLPEAFAAQEQNRVKQHNSSVQKALGSQEVKAALQEASMAGITPRELSAVALSCLGALDGQGRQVVGLLPHHVAGALRAWLQQMDGRVPALQGLSVLELCMLVAAQRLEDRGTAVFNFEMLLDEFMKAKQMQLGFLWSRQAAWRAFRDVLDQGLIAFTASRPGSRGMMQRYLPAQLRVAKGELQRGLAGHSHCPDFLTKWLRGDALNSYLSLA
ncbi:origin recognition complex subunit 4 C-terminus-domain-containing protein [Scenedesmus sp. NREL 46B-D3]|nr:origin recognition complex subunit 4 C-terminus-domain-containing protein [Scenedesmus sp. NREL 46B-D3]